MWCASEHGQDSESNESDIVCQVNSSKINIGTWLPRVSEAAAVVLDLALCSQKSPLSTPTIRNWHRSWVLRVWNLRVRTDLYNTEAYCTVPRGLLYRGLLYCTQWLILYRGLLDCTQRLAVQRLTVHSGLLSQPALAHSLTITRHQMHSLAAAALQTRDIGMQPSVITHVTHVYK